MNSVDVVSPRDIGGDNCESRTNGGKSKRKPDVFFAIGTRQTASSSIAHRVLGMIEQHVPRISGRRLGHRTTLALDSRGTTAQRIDVRVNLKSSAMSLANCDLERIIRWCPPERAAKKNRARLDLRSIVRITSGARLEVNDVEMSARCSLHDVGNFRFGVVIEASYPQGSPFGRSLRRGR